MGFFDDIKRGGGANIFGPVIGGFAGRHKRKESQREADINKRNKDIVSERTAEGRRRAEQLYGDPSQVGTGIQDVMARRKAAMEGKSPTSSRLRGQTNRQIRQAKAAGITNPAQIAQIQRQGEQDVGGALYKEQEQALGQYQSLLGNVAANTSALELGYGNLGIAQQDPYKQQGLLSNVMGGSGTVICTVMHENGYMSDEIYEKDQEYGRNLDVLTYTGYRLLADPVVKALNKSKFLTWLISFPAMAWANNMAGNKNIVGNLISICGEKICKKLGERYGIRQSQQQWEEGARILRSA